MHVHESARISQLFEIYGALLTPRQLLLGRAHIIDGKTFAAVAKEQGVSRQAVHDAVRHVVCLMEEYEAKLNILALRGVQTHNPVSCSNHAGAKIEALKKRIAQQGIIYSTDWIIRGLNEIINVLASEHEKIPSVKDD
ncbi:MAG: hypothetical protein WCK47_02790 [bacterium]|nr:hypothetical protein [Candidatus Sumerlaeota bacterium]